MSDYKHRKSDQNVSSSGKTNNSFSLHRNHYILVSVLISSIITFSVLQFFSASNESRIYKESYERPTQLTSELAQYKPKIVAQVKPQKNSHKTKMKQGSAKTIKPTKNIDSQQIKKKLSHASTQKPTVKRNNASTENRAKSSTKPNIKQGTQNLSANIKTPTEQIRRTSEIPEMTKKLRALSSPQLAQQTFAAAIKFLKQREINKAKEYLQTALNFDPKHMKARETLAGIYLRRNRSGKAVELLNDGITLNPEYFKFRLLLAQTYIDTNSEQQALDLLLNSPDKHKKSGQYHSMIAVIQQELGEYDDAIDSYMAALRIQPSESRWWLGVGLAYEYNEQFNEAEQAYLRAEQIGNLKKNILQYIQTRLRAVRLHTTPVS